MARLCEDWITSYMKMTNNSEPPQLFRLWTAIGTLAAALGRRVWFDWGDNVYTNMYIILVGKAGTRKGTAMRPGERLLRSLGAPLAAEAMTFEAMLKRLAMNAAASSGAQTPIEQQAQATSSLTVFAEEWTVFVGYGNLAMISGLCNLYDCKDVWSYETKNSGIFNLRNVWLHMVGGTTPALIRSSLPQETIGGGLTRRTIFVYGEGIEKVVIVPIRTKEEKELEDKLLHDLQDMQSLSGPFSYTKGFIQAYADWRTAHERSQLFLDTILESYRTTRPMHLLKLCLVLCVSRSNSMELEQQDFVRATKILARTEKNMLRAFSGVGRNPLSATLNEVMRFIQMRHTVTRKELMRTFWQDALPEELEAMIQSLAMQELVSIQSRPDGIYYTFTEPTTNVKDIL